MVFGFKHKKPLLPNPETGMMLLNTQLQNEARGSLSEEMQKTEDTTNYNMTHDDPIEEFLESASIGEGGDKRPNPISFGLRVCLSPLNRLAFIDPYDAETYKLEVENEIEIMSCNMREDEYESGGIFLLEAYKRAILIGLDDAKKGHKAQILKMKQTASRITFGSESERLKYEGRT